MARANSLKENQAVTPLMPSTPKESESGKSCSRTFRRMPCPSDSAYSCQPSMPMTASPSWYKGWREATTRPAAKLRITSPKPTAAA